MRFSPLFSSFYRKRFHAIGLALGGLFFFFIPVFAQALTITPPRIEVDGDPGTTIKSEFKITNDSESSQTYYTQVENFEAKDESGNPQFVQTREGLSVWTNVQPSITVASRGQATIPFEIRVPRNAEPGGYFASIFVRTTPPPTKAGEVSIGARLGTLVLLRVNGNIQEGVDILEYSTKGNSHFYTSLPVELYYRFQNTGDDRVKPTGEILIKNIVGLKAKILNANPTDGSVLPRSIRRFETAWINGGGGQQDPEAKASQIPSGFLEAAKYEWHNFAFGYYTANLNITFGPNNNTASEKLRFFVLPWQLISIFVVILLIILIILRFLLRRYNRYIISRHQLK